MIPSDFLESFLCLEGEEFQEKIFKTQFSEDNIIFLFSALPYSEGIRRYKIEEILSRINVEYLNCYMLLVLLTSSNFAVSDMAEQLLFKIKEVRSDLLPDPSVFRFFTEIHQTPMVRKAVTKLLGLGIF